MPIHHSLSFWALANVIIKSELCNIRVRIVMVCSKYLLKIGVFDFRWFVVNTGVDILRSWFASLDCKIHLPLENFNPQSHCNIIVLWISPFCSVDEIIHLFFLYYSKLWLVIINFSIAFVVKLYWYSECGYEIRLHTNKKLIL